MAINKDHIHDMVEIFYQAPFKTFYINSRDGITFTKPYAVFVSLGITTSLQVLTDIKNVLTRSEGGYKTKLVILKSNNVLGQFLNVPIEEPEIQQYDMDPKSYPSQLWGESDIQGLLDANKDNEGITSQIEKLISKINSGPSGWENCYIFQEKPDWYNIFHTKVNYRKDPDGSEYRIGIYVEATD